MCELLNRPKHASHLGRSVRTCIVNFHTGRADVEALPEIVARVGRAVDARLRPPLG